MAPFYGRGSTALRLATLRGGSLLFTTKFPESPGTHFIDLGRMKRCRPWSHPVVLNTGPLDWEFHLANILLPTTFAGYQINNIPFATLQNPLNFIFPLCLNPFDFSVDREGW